jgi:hypothetical protein
LRLEAATPSGGSTIGEVTATSPRLDRRLRRAAVRLDDAEQPIAETWRRIGALAEELGCPRPGYDTIRLIVREHRRRRAEVHELLQPVISDLLQGRVSAWDVERIIEAGYLDRSED